MEVLRLILKQNQANYRKEETIKNKMTYPLPPFSTVIGAIHSACKFTEYHPMDLSIQGTFESMHKEPYTDYCFLNSVMDDRGILIKLKNSNMLCNAYDKVASAKKSKGNSFRKGITIDVYNQELLNEYRSIKNKKDELTEFKRQRIEPFLQRIKQRKIALNSKKNSIEKGTREYELVVRREKEIKDLEKEIKSRLKTYENEHYNIPYSRFASLTTSLAYYEVLDNIKLIIHIKSDADTLNKIKDNIYNLQSLGRSEDFVEVVEAVYTTLTDEIQEDITSLNSAYLPQELIIDEYIILNEKPKGIDACGTKYIINKNYTIENSKRIFEKKKVVYTSNYSVDEESKHVYLDHAKDQTYIVTFV